MEQDDRRDGPEGADDASEPGVARGKADKKSSPAPDARLTAEDEATESDDGHLAALRAKSEDDAGHSPIPD